MVTSHSNEASLQKKAASRDLLMYFLSALSCLDAWENTKSRSQPSLQVHSKWDFEGLHQKDEFTAKWYKINVALEFQIPKKHNGH